MYIHKWCHDQRVYSYNRDQNAPHRAERALRVNEIPRQLIFLLLNLIIDVDIIILFINDQISESPLFLFSVIASELFHILTSQMPMKVHTFSLLPLKFLLIEMKAHLLPVMLKVFVGIFLES